MGRDQLTAIVLIVVMIVGAGSVLVLATQPTRPPIDSYVYEMEPYNGYFIVSIDPHYHYGDDGSIAVIEQVYETLYTYPWGSGERGGHPESTPTIPLLAAGPPTISENGTVYTIELRQGVTFHDGTPFNASAAVWNFKRAMKMGLRYAELIKGGTEMKDVVRTYGSTSDEFKDVFEAWEATDAVEASGTYEITYRLEEAVAFFIPVMTDPTFCMMSPTFAEKHAVNHSDSFGVEYGEIFTYMCNHTCGTGPYKVVELKRSEHVRMTLNQNYWRAEATEATIAPPLYAGSIREIWFKANEDQTSMNLNLKNGVADDTYWPSSYADEIYDSVTLGSKDPNIFFRTGGVSSYMSGFRFQMGIMNWTIGSDTFEIYSPFHWRGLRKAMAYLLDYDAYIQSVTSGWNVKAQGPIPAWMPYHNSSHWTEHYEPEIAVGYWNDAMQDPDFVAVMNAIRGKIILPYHVFQNPLELISLLLKDGFDAMKLLPEMNTTGLDYEPMITPAPSYIGLPREEPLLLSNQWIARYADPHDLVFFYLHSRGYSSQLQGYNNSVMDNLIMQGRAETDPVVRQDIYNQIQELAAYDQPFLGLYSPKEFTTFRAWLKGIGLRYQPLCSYYYIYHVYKDYTTTDTTTTPGDQITTGTPLPTSPELPDIGSLVPIYFLAGLGWAVVVVLLIAFHRWES
ncbi:MAG: ABC transporter substrate-binding protein [Promethearchaeota archaeon]